VIMMNGRVMMRVIMMVIDDVDDGVMVMMESITLKNEMERLFQCHTTVS
jgi:hypothetical protein